MHSIALLLHLVGFAAFLGGAFAQQQFIKLSTRETLAPAVRDSYESLAAAITTKIELPGLMVQVVSGVLFLVSNPAWLKMPWMHGKLSAVVLLLVLAHLEMFNARAIARLRTEGGTGSDSAIARRKITHARMGSAGTVLVVAVVGLVVYGRG